VPKQFATQQLMNVQQVRFMHVGFRENGWRICAEYLLVLNLKTETKYNPTAHLCAAGGSPGSNLIGCRSAARYSSYSEIPTRMVSGMRALTTHTSLALDIHAPTHAQRGICKPSWENIALHARTTRTDMQWKGRKRED
jgi:hypothetical protein